MTDTIFFRLLNGVNRPSRLSDAVEALGEDGETADVYLANPSSLQQVPGSPFSYFVSEAVRSLFGNLRPTQNDETQVCEGLNTTDNERFVRLSWEVSAHSVGRKRRWVPLAKGGEHAVFYSDLHLLVDWENNGERLKEVVRFLYGSETKRIYGQPFYFREGITYSQRTQKGLSFRCLPKYSIFNVKGPGIFAPTHQLLPLLALLNSSSYRQLVELQTAFGSYNVGYLQRTPLPRISQERMEQLRDLALSGVDTKRRFDSANETSHAFCLPALRQASGETFEERIVRWQAQVLDGARQLAEYQRKIDDIAYQIYGIEGEDRRAIEESLNGGDGVVSSGEDAGATETEDSDETTAVLDAGTLAADLLSYAIGCVFGRWDARIAVDPSLAPKLQDPFAPLPVCSPGMLVGPDSLPAQRDGIASEEWMLARPDTITPPPEGLVENPVIPDTEYPLVVDWDGILVDDPDHPDDIVRRVRDVLELLWGGRADEIEHEACELLGVKDLRAYFRNPRKFWDFHVKRYSKSRRKAPIYWLLQSPKKNFGLWLYYHRLDPDILFKALTKYVEPKIRLEDGRLGEFEARRRDAGTGGREAKQAEKAIEDQEALLTDLREFRDRLQRAASLYLRPDLNDGVVLNIAPLHELVPWKEAKIKWDDLLAGKYEWSSVGKQLCEKGLV